MHDPLGSTGRSRSTAADDAIRHLPGIALALMPLLLLHPAVATGQSAQSADPAALSARPYGAGGSVDPAATQVTSAAALGENLLANPGAEAGAISSTGFDVVAIPGWVRTGTVTVVRYATNAGLWPAVSQLGPLLRGNAFFSGGPLVRVDSLRQDIDLSALAATVDSGAVRFDLAGFLGGIGNTTDHAQVQVRFLDGAGAMLAASSIGPVTAADRANVTGLLLRAATGPLPAGARTAAVAITFTGTSGLYVWGFADSVGLSLARVQVAGVEWPAGTTGLHLVVAPDPAVVETSVAFTLPESGAARVEVLDVTGRRVALLAEGARPAGRYEIRWSPRRDGVQPGMYFVRLVTDSGTVVRKLVTLSR
jgi:hypothetical protein